MKIIISQERKDKLYKHFEDFMSNLKLKADNEILGRESPVFISGKEVVFVKHGNIMSQQYLYIMGDFYNRITSIFIFIDQDDIYKWFKDNFPEFKTEGVKITTTTY
jgi:hypothetical protein